MYMNHTKSLNKTRDKSSVYLLQVFKLYPPPASGTEGTGTKHDSCGSGRRG